ncbi:MAG: type II toxin-antitoxin system RelE/ParE family toxin [Hyphomonadaceae bacterium]|nr:type II toxin-antitoxin system RelE/ParE family toxin [Hyphomonadaceae bacterium]
MSRFRVTPRARRDLDAMADYSLAAWGDRQTEKYLGELEQRFRFLAHNPHVGRARDEIGEGYRSSTHGAHVIFYIINGAEIAIIGIPHGAMDVEAYFGRQE